MSLTFHLSNEGYLSDPSTFNGLLILLREPNTGGKKPPYFWMKDVVIPNHGEPRGRDYYQKLSAYVSLLGYCLEQCAYANLNPNGGTGRAGPAYLECLQRFQDPGQWSSTWPFLLHDDIHTILTVRDIAAAIHKAREPVREIAAGFSIKGRPPLPAFQFTNEETGKMKTVYTIYHPRTWGRSHYTAGDIALPEGQDK